MIQRMRALPVQAHETPLAANIPGSQFADDGDKAEWINLSFFE